MNFLRNLKEMPLSQKVFYIIMLLFGCIFFTTLIGNHYYFRTYAFDYGVYNFAFWDYAHFHVSLIPCLEVVGNSRMTFMQDHFSLTFWYFVPLFWIFNWLTGSYTLLILLALFILWSGWATYKLIKLKTNDEWLAVISVLYYFLLQGRYSSFASDCNILIIICCFVPLFLFYFELKKYVVAGILLILLLFSREDMPIWFIFIFLVIGTWHWKDKRVLALCVGGILVCIVYFIVLFKAFIPMLETPNKPYTLFQYSVLGKTPTEALGYCIMHPIDTFKLLYINQFHNPVFNNVKEEFYLVYLISGGFILFFRPQYFIWFIPVIAQKVFNDDEGRWGINGYYSITIVTLLPISVFLIISKFKLRWLRYSFSILVCIMALSVTWYKMNINNRAVPWGTTIKENMFDPAFFHPDYDAGLIHKVLKLIPPDAKLSASSSILPHVSQRSYIYEFPDFKGADYIAAFTFKDYYVSSDSAYSMFLNHLIFYPGWDIVSYIPPFILLKKNKNGTYVNKVFDSIECGAEYIASDKKHLITSDGEFTDNPETRDSSVKRNGCYSCKVSSKNQFGYTYHGVNFKTGDFLKITVWKYPAIKDTGNLIVSWGKDIGKFTFNGIKKDSLGWEELELYIMVPKVRSDFKVFVMNDKSKPIWFDDLKIVKCSVK